MKATQLKSRLDFAIRVAMEAGQRALAFYCKKEYRVQYKGEGDFLTEGDLQVEAYVKAEVAKFFPDDSFWGEESGLEKGRSGARWIVDPIDGTEAFIEGIPQFSTLIALEVKDEVLLGVAYFPALKELAYGVKGQGAWWVRGAGEAVRAKVSEQLDLASSTFCYTSKKRFRTSGQQELLEKLFNQCGQASTWGDAYGHILVATGRADFAVDPVMMAWDCGALKPILEEAGGHFVSFSGEKSIHGGSAISCNEKIYPTLKGVFGIGQQAEEDFPVGL